MAEPLQKTWAQEQLAAAAAAYMSAYFDAVPRQEPERSEWYARYGMLIDFTSFLWENYPNYAQQRSDQS